ncbi:MAG TPA: aldo/keto reductase [archaeon]|nr:aldo/keto reductase [archaeon]
MKDRHTISRKMFLKGCGTTIIGLGLGSSCGRPAAGQNRDLSEGAPGLSSDSRDSVSGEKKTAYRTLGKAGIKVTELCFGASRTMDPSLVHHALECGINYIDTGRSYYNGENEFMVGKVIQGRRQQVVVNSKLPRASVEKMQKDLETSLKALRTDYIDCLLLHSADTAEDIVSDEVKRFFTRAREQGKVRTFGFSTHNNSLLETAAAEKFYEVVMLPYNFMGSYHHMLGGSYHEWDSQFLARGIEICGQAGIDFIAIKSCSGGFKKEGGGPQTYRAALKWVLENPYVKSIAAAMGNFQQIEENVQSMGEGALLPGEKILLDSYAEHYGAWFCRMCGQCRGKCPRGVDVALVNRLHMYAVGYGGDMAREAHATYVTLGKRGAAACVDCKTCRIECPYGLPLSTKLADAHALLG